MLASVAGSAVIGCYVAIGGDVDETEGRLLGSSLAVFGASTLSLICGAAWERGRLAFVPPLGIALAIVSLVLTLVLIWQGTSIENESYWKTLATISTPAVAAAHASFVAFFRLRGRYRLALVAAFALNTAVTTLALLAIWWEAVSDNEPLARMYGTVIVLLIATTIAIPVLRRLEGPAGEGESSEPVTRFCPNCGESLHPEGVSQCPACGASFQVQLTLP